MKLDLKLSYSAIKHFGLLLFYFIVIPFFSKDCLIEFFNPERREVFCLLMNEFKHLVPKN